MAEGLGPVTIGRVSEFAVVRLADGRVGWKGHWAKQGRCMVVLADGSGVELGSKVEVEVIRFPAQLAREYVENNPSP